ncbi:glutathione peroxidase [Nitrospirillum pindoramense]|uniref:Glutathione peroxidase n=1 Tax=Nitrospirillum amazonense TaxID=28077 RepID=A0A560HFC6_9PROT|nr:glutathione peroxidase [Nitrospirillum amazonense]TWB45128.1 glutathione peroxidase [Nitrospirillum amazonense]
MLPQPQTAAAPSAHTFTFQRLGGQGAIPLAAFAGQPVLVVNTASNCRFTNQYEDLQALHAKYGPRGLVVLGVPSNDFGKQEPGSASEIGAFCQRNYGVEFTMADKEVVVGATAHPFFGWLVDVAGEDAAPRWNFHKYLLGKDGRLVRYWSSVFRPSNEAIIQAVETALA